MADEETVDTGEEQVEQPKASKKRSKPAPAITYTELYEARTEMENARDEVAYWKRALDAANSINTLTHKAIKVAEVTETLTAASERYSAAYADFHTLRAKAKGAA